MKLKALWHGCCAGDGLLLHFAKTLASPWNGWSLLGAGPLPLPSAVGLPPLWPLHARVARPPGHAAGCVPVIEAREADLVALAIGVPMKLVPPVVCE